MLDGTYISRNDATIMEIKHMVEVSDLIWIVDAESKYNRSREWFLKQIKLGKLHKTKIEGDRKVYLLLTEVEQLLRPRIIDL